MTHNWSKQIDDGFANNMAMTEVMEQAFQQGKAEGRKEAVFWVRKLMRYFWTDWNKQSHKKLSYLAFDELDEWILEQADEANGRVFMEQIKTIDKTILYDEHEIIRATIDAFDGCISCGTRGFTKRNERRNTKVIKPLTIIGWWFFI